LDFLVLDIETVPIKLEDKTVIDYLIERNKMKLSLHPLFCKIIHIGLKWNEGSSINTEHLEIKDDNEASLLKEFWNFITKKGFSETLKCNKWGDFENPVNQSQIVTFNGDTFDIPIISLKSSIYGITNTVNINTKPYRDMKKSNHFDCLRFIAGSDLGKMIKLEIACATLGIKVPEIKSHSESIKSLYNKGKFYLIKKKNEKDLILTMKLHLKLIGKSEINL
jgi:predicted PolB exonuclease-like 3'-5' exonuclease